MALIFLKLLTVTLALAITYEDSPTFSSHKSKSHSFKFDE